MTHSDDNGLVLPPRVAPIQVVVVPITKGSGADHDQVMETARAIVQALKNDKIRVKLDDRPNLRFRPLLCLSLPVLSSPLPMDE